ncbi:hypothetical protein ACFWBF_01430 [Streptomyces sp. NPDC060028]|uniref:hypothetical protein n=1 Tax=Streptomyces sp. NPDC060028 TaxID=3347041 RepID=UPI0036B6E5CA
MTALIGRAVGLTVGLRRPGGLVEEEQAYAEVPSDHLKQLSADATPGVSEEPESASVQVSRLREVLLAARTDRG